MYFDWKILFKGCLILKNPKFCYIRLMVFVWYPITLRQSVAQGLFNVGTEAGLSSRQAQRLHMIRMQGFSQHSYQAALTNCPQKPRCTRPDQPTKEHNRLKCVEAQRKDWSLIRYICPIIVVKFADKLYTVGKTKVGTLCFVIVGILN